MNYTHINCDNCGGVIGMFDRQAFTCERCGKEFVLHRMNYDRLKINDKTGWIFPVLDNQVNQDILSGKGLKPLAKDHLMPSGIRKYP